MTRKLRVAILTKDPAGFGAVCAEKIFEMDRVEIVGVVIDDGRVTGRWTWLRRRLRKFLKLGPLALIPAMWIRRVARKEHAMAPVPVSRLAERRGVPVLRVASVNDPAVAGAVKTWRTDVALSLGNSLMKKRTFSAARLGTLNVHHAKVPEFRGSPPVLWEIHDGRLTVGYTIHLVDSGVDTGGVLGEGEVPLVIAGTLEETYRRTRASVFEASTHGLVEVLNDIADGRFQPRAQVKHDVPARTTPTYREWRRILGQFRKMKASAWV